MDGKRLIMYENLFSWRYFYCKKHPSWFCEVFFLKTNDYVKYITETFIKYMDQPKEERKRKKEAKESKEDLLYKWFGMIPFALSAKFKRKK